MTEKGPKADLHYRHNAVSPPLPWKTRFFITVLSTVTDASRRSDGTVNRRLLSFLDPCSTASSKPVAGVRTADVTVDPSRNLWFRLFVPAAATGRIPLIVFFHGGGFAFLSPGSRAYDAVCRRICRKVNAVIVSVNYRLSPEHRCPAQYEDGEDVLRFLDGGGLARSDPAAAGLVDLSSCFLAGDSAGANIAHHVARRWAAAAAGGERKTLRLAGLVAIQAYFGGEERTEAEIRLQGAPLVSTRRTDWLWRAFLPEGEDRDHEAVNVFGPRAAALEESHNSLFFVRKDNQQNERAEELEEGDEWEYVEEGPAEIIWQGNEIIVNKKGVRVAKKRADRQPIKEDDDRPTSNPLPPQFAAVASYKNGPSMSAQENQQNERAEELEEGDEWEYVEEGPAEIIWQGNEIIVNKKGVRVAKKRADRQPIKEDDDRPTSNPLPPQFAAVASYKNGPSMSAQEVLEKAVQQNSKFWN
ncbi:putative carboxylesterase 18 [Cocos nucifera]|nr:putative carboxylesterase 18 [Cocos nucifera]